MRIKKLIDLYKRESAEVFDNIPTTKINEFVDMVFEAYENEQTIENQIFSEKNCF